jgi:hypothetical protein
MEKMELKEKFLNAFKSFGKVTLFIGAIFLGYVSCEIYHMIRNGQEKPQLLQSVRKIKETSVAINERGELMIIDRTNGGYVMYEDSVGQEIFTLYSGSLQSKYQNP